MIQSPPPEAVESDIDRMADATTDLVMERLHIIVRKAVTLEVSHELADQRAQLDEERCELDRMRREPLPPPRIPPHALVAAAAKVATAALKLENDKFSRGERSAQAALDAAIDELRSAYRAYSAIHPPKGL